MKIQGLNNQYQYNKLNNNLKQNDSKKDLNNRPSFQGVGDKIGEMFGKYYAKPMLNQGWLHSASKKMSGASNLMTQHMATLGSFLTSSVYFYKTVTNKELEPDKRNTLGINQIGCFVVPTACAYIADRSLKKINKNMEYSYSGYMRHLLANGEISGEKAEKLTQSFGTKLKGFQAMMGLATFTLIYRYATPVIITPIANVLGEKWNNKKAEQQAAKEAELKNETTDNKSEKLSVAA